MGTDLPDGELEALLAAAGVRLDLAGGTTGTANGIATAGVATAGVAIVTLAAPERRNAMTPATWRALASIGRVLTGDVRVVILRSEGPSFCAGLDRRMMAVDGTAGEPGLLAMAAMDDGALDETIARYQEAFTWWRRTDLVSIAAIQGHAVGAGFQLALACDLRVLADDAQFAMRETTLGLVPDLGGTQPLVDVVGYSRALEICLTGRWIGADEASALGLGTVVVPRADLDAAVSDLAAAILAAPRDAVIETKALLKDAGRRTYDDQRAAERAAQARRLHDLALTSANPPRA
jgi:enoyl-CoA hydratase/carnithine racemase